MQSLRNLDRSTAERIAVQALAFLAADVERLGRFLSVTGLSPDTIRTSAREPGFLGGVLDYMAADESLLMTFAADAGLDPSLVGEAHAALAGQRPGP